MPIGMIALLGSGETARAGGTVFERLAAELPCPVRVSVLETPAGFETNSAQVAGRVAEFIKLRLQHVAAEVRVIPARRRGSDFSPDDPAILVPLLYSDLIFMGPGSPTYAIRQLSASLAWDLVRARHRLGAALVLASSATIAVGAWGLPVYEIFKVGEDVHAVPGLNLLKDFGLEASFVPHWNNAEGTDGLDTRRCFVGLDRFELWRRDLPAEHLTVGIDEHTWLLIDLENQRCEVGGVGGVSIVRGDEARTFATSKCFEAGELGALRMPVPSGAGIRAEAWEMIGAAAPAGADVPTDEILRLVEERRKARARRDWSASDKLRDQMGALGWQVQDTEEGEKLIKAHLGASSRRD